jgi:hypothetical protein
MKSLAIVENVLYSPGSNRKSTVDYESCFYIGITLTTLPKASLNDRSARHEQMRFNFGIFKFALKLNLPWNYARLGSHHEIMAVIVVKDDRWVQRMCSRTWTSNLHGQLFVYQKLWSCCFGERQRCSAQTEFRVQTGRRYE